MNQEKSAENKKSYQEGLHDLIHAHQTFQEELKAAREKIKKDLLEIADQGEFEDLRREVEKYFG